MFLSGFADEAGADLETQIRATQELGWSRISARSIEGVNLHELSEEVFDKVVRRLDEAGIEVVELGSLIGNWAKDIEGDLDITRAEIERAIPRMKRLGTQLVRVMSYAQKPWGEDQHEEERFARLREVVARFTEAGLVVAHENCMNYGGFSASHSLRLVEEVPGLKLIFDTGNPVFQRDRSQPEPAPWQDSLAFYEAVAPHVCHVHIKDCLYPCEGESEPERYTLPGEGDGQVVAILQRLKEDGYEGGLAIEPHVATVFHAREEEVDVEQCYRSYVEYGRCLEGLLAKLG